MKIVTWNVNSIRAREERLLAWLKKEKPDVLCLQELKVTNEKFPYDLITEAGYYSAVHGQPTYNGVAILSLTEPEDVVCGIQDDEDDPQARLIEATVNGARIINGYFPNGKEVGSDKYEYKLRWMQRLSDHMERTTSPDKDVVLVGDFNVAPDDSDVADPNQWAGSVLCYPDTRKAYEKFLSWGFTDVFRKHNPDGGVHTWWDYRRLAFQRNNGLRIDLVLATKSMAERCVAASVDRDERKGDKPSDHAPVIVEFS